MTRRSVVHVDLITQYPGAKFVFIGLVLLVFVLAASHLIVIDRFEGIVAGLPTWIWIQIAVVGLMTLIAYYAIRIKEAADRGGA